MAKKFTQKLSHDFCRAVSDHVMTVGESGILVGYSGGADSSALLHLLRPYCEKHGIYLRAMHVHHGIRGAEADRDAAFCEAECERMGVDFMLERVDVPALAKESGRGIEETARECRYRAFARLIASDERLSCIATAHNADDNAETVLMNLTRGCGIDGLCGIPPVRGMDGMRIIRPLIYVPKCDIVGYCEENRIEYIFDSTNDDPAYSRNYIRGELMPGLRRLNPSFAASISRMTTGLRADREYLAAQAEGFAAEYVRDDAVDAAVLANAPMPIASRVVSMMFSRLSDRMPERVHINAVLALAEGENGAAVSLPDGVRAVKHSGMLQLTRQTDDAPAAFRYELHPGINRFKMPDFAVLIAKNGDSDGNFEKDNEYLKNIYNLSIHTQVNSDKIKCVLYVRSREDGDSYVYGGMNRRLKKLYNDRGLDADARARLPVFCDGDGIIWVPGFGTADRVSIDSDQTLTIQYYYN